MKPLIGITLHEEEGKFTLNSAYVKCIAAAGGIPLLLPHGTVIAAAEIQKILSGLLLTGGGDIDPLFFGEEPAPELGKIIPERDSWELELCQQFLQAHKPILGICRGMQVLNVAAGGNLWQTIPTKEIKHFQDAPVNYATHGLKLVKDSLLTRILETTQMRVNSLHHQAVHLVAPGCRVVASASDGTIEAIESREQEFAIGVQWHPEHLWECPETKKIFFAFIRKSKNE